MKGNQRPVWYLDTSAALKLIVQESGSAALALSIRDSNASLTSTTLLEIEMRRAAHRLDELTQAAVSLFLKGIDLHGVPAPLFTQAGLLPGKALRSLDALHLAAAIALHVDAVVSYDARLISAAESAGLATLRPQ